MTERIRGVLRTFGDTFTGTDGTETRLAVELGACVAHWDIQVCQVSSLSDTYSDTQLCYKAPNLG
ncbi:hypothetical protein DPMN_138471 [Dreissena polymorpha]|uniref:Uncharacterized protein n=1 Tax=Dreissena polymorpha TaxID=45954 RepID=A0A9D4G3W4_DREPO|nr:hypothetical protein DPMN_134937 [Dreissena polymorpha]KAH3810085.1 hypothetical protein DPMN_138471 [Dreissena polymorpha]